MANFAPWASLAGGMLIGAIAVYARLSRLAGRARPILAQAYSLPERTDIDWRLIAGAALFRIGWEIGGLCPGPAVVSLGAGHPPVLVFALAMAAGMYLYRLVETRAAVAGGFAPRAGDVPLAAAGTDC
jgi:uncharacterized protein